MGEAGVAPAVFNCTAWDLLNLDILLDVNFSLPTAGV